MTTLLLERYLGGLYMLAGPFTWGLFLFGMIKGRDRMSLLKRPLFDLPDPAPRATILVPIKDEAHQVRTCLASVLAQDYPADKLQIICIDDRSTDGTGEILDEIAKSDPRLQIVHIKPGELPGGWVGKSHALHVGMKQATGDWLLFVDSDVALTPDALRGTIALAEYKRFDLVSLLPKLINETFWEKLIVPLGGAATSAMYLLPMTNYNEQPNIAFANGQYLCARRTAYEKIGGHEAVRETLSEDIALAKAMKKIGLRPRLSTGADFVSTRMYNSFSMVIKGWARNFFCGSAGRMPKTIGAILFVLLCGFSCYAAVGWGIYRNIHPLEWPGGWGWILAGIAHWSIMTTALATMYAWSGNSKRYAFLFPLGGALLIWIWTRTLKMCATGKVEWRGTQYAHRAGEGVVNT